MLVLTSTRVKFFYANDLQIILLLMWYSCKIREGLKNFFIEEYLNSS